MLSSDQISSSPDRSTYVVLFATSCRDPADHTPAPPDRRTPSNCANLQAPGDTWVQLRTASLVEPAHHVSVRPSPACCLLPPLGGCIVRCKSKVRFPRASHQKACLKLEFQVTKSEGLEQFCTVVNQVLNEGSSGQKIQFFSAAAKQSGGKRDLHLPSVRGCTSSFALCLLIQI